MALKVGRKPLYTGEGKKVSVFLGGDNHAYLLRIVQDLKQSGKDASVSRIINALVQQYRGVS